MIIQLAKWLAKRTLSLSRAMLDHTAGIFRIRGRATRGEFWAKNVILLIAVYILTAVLLKTFDAFNNIALRNGDLRMLSLSMLLLLIASGVLMFVNMIRRLRDVEPPVVFWPIMAGLIFLFNAVPALRGMGQYPVFAMMLIAALAPTGSGAMLSNKNRI